MQSFIAILLTLFYSLGLGCGVVSGNTDSAYIGTPNADSYSREHAVSMSPWDMVIVDGKLYLGGGDYNKNTGPVDVWCCDLSTHTWFISGTLNDEAIGKFKVINETIYAPGFDSKESTWEYGNYHRFENGQWHTNGNLPEAVHCFDIEQYNGQLFFGIGTANGSDSPVKITSDNGITFSDVPFYHDEVDILQADYYDFNRVYDFFITDSGLYCLLLSIKGNKVESYDFYKFDEQAFHFVSDHYQNNIAFTIYKQEPISSKVTFQGNCYIAAGSLTRTTDFQTSERIVLPYNESAIDLLVDNGNLYVLCAKENEDGQFITRIYAYIYNSFWYCVTSFESQNLPLSFAKNDQTFYVGLSHYNAPESAGSIYEISVSNIPCWMFATE